LKDKFKLEHVYIHVPFCLQKCGYCSFYSEIFSPELKKQYLVSLQNEITLFRQIYNLLPKTIYFGGGSPSLLSAQEIGAILSKFDISQCEEITIEVNPVSINESYIRQLLETPVNRISLGIQSFQDNELTSMGRLHDSRQAERAFQALRQSGFPNISCDLIYGLPQQTKEDLISTLNKFIELAPEHISTYCLSLKKNLPMYSVKNQIPPDEEVADFYLLIREQLLAAGFQQYEISNFAKPGFESQHNLCYWNDKFYLGLGPAAAGYLPRKDKRFRYANQPDIYRYFDQIKQKKIHVNSQHLSPEEHEKEFIFLALRKSQGLDMNLFQKRFGCSFTEKYRDIINKYKREKLLETEGSFVRLTPEAYFVSNEIYSDFI
jgi:oxygen-independent coproporphyrinogen-3 oxidase